MYFLNWLKLKQSLQFLKQKTFYFYGFIPSFIELQRRGWDSNPRYILERTSD